MQAAAPDNELARLRQRVAELEGRVTELEVSLDSVPVLISYISSDERYHRVNKAYESLFGVPRENIEGHTVRDLMQEPNYATLKPNLDRAFAGEQLTFETPYLHQDGTLHDAAVVYTPHKRADGKVQG